MSIIRRLDVAVWNLRFRVAYAILPGGHKHIALADHGEKCRRCGVRVP